MVALMDDDDEDYSPKPSKDLRRLQRTSTSRWTIRLDDEGEPNPGWIVRNCQDKNGYACPRLQFIEESKQPSMQSLAIEWGVPATKITDWRREQNWDNQRAKYQQEIKQKMLERSAADIADMRSEALQRGLGGFKTLQDLILNYARTGRKPKMASGSGEVIYVPFEPKDLGNLTKAYSEAVKGELVMLGLTPTVQRDAEDIPDEDQSKPLNVLVFNMPATDEEQQTYAGQLPSGNPLGDSAVRSPAQSVEAAEIIDVESRDTDAR